MWKQMKDEAARPTAPSASPAPAAPAVSQSPIVPAIQPKRGEQEPMKEELASIGKSIIIKGELSGGEDLTIEGQVEGKIELHDHVLTVGPNGRIKAQINAKAIVVLGQVTGNLTATEKVDIRENGSVEGDVAAPRIAIADGSHFRGSIDMQRKESSSDRSSAVFSKAPVAAGVHVSGEFASV
jgi:cytoskeletal protein CcmA (bactofilin family)